MFNFVSWESIHPSSRILLGYSNLVGATQRPMELPRNLYMLRVVVFKNLATHDAIKMS